MEELREALQKLVEERGQAEVARHAGISQATVSRLLRGSRIGTLGTWRKLLAAYPELGRFFLSPNKPNGK
jgi:transcriptional regulator with XRE-family HTH domain